MLLQRRLRLEIAILVICCLFVQIFANRNKISDTRTVWKSFGNYTAAERRAIDKFRPLMGKNLYAGHMTTDQYLIRWLRSEHLDLDRARAKLIRALEFRKKNRIDHILEEDYTNIIKQCPYDTTGVDRMGRPIVTLQIGTCPVRKISLAGELDHLRRALYHVVEKVVVQMEAAQANGSEVNSIIGIMSGLGFNLREHACLNCFSLVAEALIIYEEHYPEYYERIFVINIPRIMETMITFAKSFLSERTKSILKFYGYNREEWLPEILKYVSPEQLDQQFGGTRRTRAASRN